MKIYPAWGLRVLTGLVLFISFVACSPKGMIKVQVMDAETHRPIKGAAVAIRWLEDSIGGPTAQPKTLDAVQALSDEQGIFQIPEYPEKNYILGVYKRGYICWSSRVIFLMNPDKFGTEKYQRRKRYQIKDGMQIELKPLEKEDSKLLHAGFTVMVTGESTDSHNGPFQQATEPEFQLWRQGLRKDFQDQLGD
jgi:hypothetical protein